MTIETELAALVKIYAKFDEVKKVYVSHLDKSALLRLDADLAKFINQQLLVNGPDKENIAKNYKKLTLYFHPDRSSAFLPEVIWLEQNLSQDNKQEACFKSLGFCYEKLINPEKFKEISFSDINSKEDCRKWLESLKSKAETYTARSFFDSLIGLLDESSGFFNEVGQIKPKGLKTLLTFMPILFASYGTIILGQELLAIYALYFLMLKGGQYLERSEVTEMRSVGRALQEVSVITATATTTLMVRLLEMTFWVSHQCFDVSLQIGSSILKPLLPAPTKDAQSHGVNPGTNLCQDLILASQNLSEGIQFKNPELKVISAPLEAYLGLNAQQFLGDWRIGKKKRLMVEAFLFKMRVLDAGADAIEAKLIAAQKELEKIKENKEVYAKGGKTAEAVDSAEKVITLLSEQDSSTWQLVVYEGQKQCIQ
ncbi:J domain-containing protein [Legionella maioricensis]|uniref:J domain-containing protein n=1 Tax=Legionella maioricensis TaxID=2896528 RepID=A0A9X2D3Z5_9GAMM|nr:J domain-containing protein [Legionella maioricensis]MCL9685620.1 J domain-containing protein [Legionella maioricensis]MCL9689029.1 J domain-containing protein [Legionella maioricensis]